MVVHWLETLLVYHRRQKSVAEFKRTVTGLHSPLLSSPLFRIKILKDSRALTIEERLRRKDNTKIKAKQNKQISRLFNKYIRRGKVGYLLGDPKASPFLVLTGESQELGMASVVTQTPWGT